MNGPEQAQALILLEAARRTVNNNRLFEQLTEFLEKPTIKDDLQVALKMLGELGK